MMFRRRAFRPTLLVMLGLLCVGVASATSISFTGTFVQDDDMQILYFNLQSATTVTIETWSFGGSSLAPGGTNAAGNVISAGGFWPVLSVFNDTTGSLEASDAGGNLSCPSCALDLTTGVAMDAYINVFLQAGTYMLVLTENDNTAIGPNLADGFLRSGLGNFTSDYSGGTDPGPFLWPFQDNNGNYIHQTEHWAVDITGADYAGTTPEPASLALVATGLVLFFAPRLFGSRRIPKI
jgi:hypothetical protein